jgi:glycosyltransferase involved in cell wall biosynthesis
VHDTFETEVPARPSLLMVATVGGTIGAFLAPYAAHFRELGWRVDAAAAGAPEDPRVVAAFDQVHDLPLSRSMRDLAGLARGWRAIRNLVGQPYDIVHVHTPIASFLTRAAVRQVPRAGRAAVAYTAHGFHFRVGGPALPNALFLTAERIAGRWTDRLIVINAEDERAAIDRRIVPARRLVRMPGIGLNTSHYSPSAVPEADVARAREAIGVPADAPLFTIVGELNVNKRQADAILALEQIQATGAHLALAGDGPLRGALDDLARRRGLERRVHLLGGIPDVRPLVRASTAVLLLSTREGLARSVMEALALGVPVIASTARGNRELINGNAGVNFETGDVDALARAMRWMIEHPAERLAMGARGRARMVERYDVRNLLALHERLYADLLAERAPAPVSGSARDPRPR